VNGTLVVRQPSASLASVSGSRVKYLILLIKVNYFTGHIATKSNLIHPALWHLGTNTLPFIYRSAKKLTTKFKRSRRFLAVFINDTGEINEVSESAIEQLKARKVLDLFPRRCWSWSDNLLVLRTASSKFQSSD